MYYLRYCYGRLNPRLTLLPPGEGQPPLGTEVGGPQVSERQHQTDVVPVRM